MKTIVVSCLTLAAFLPSLNGMDEVPSRRIRLPSARELEIDALDIQENQALFAEIVLWNHGNDIYVRNAALGNLFDQNLLEKVLKEVKDSGVRRFVIRRIDNQELIREIAKNDNDLEVRQTAVERLQVLDRIQLTDEDKRIRLPSARELEIRALDIQENQALFAEIVLNEKDIYVRNAAIGRLFDQNLLEEVLKASTDSNVRRSAIKKFNNFEIIAEIVKNDDDPEVRQTAIERLLGAAEQGDAKAQYRLSILYLQGTGVDKDIKK